MNQVTIEDLKQMKVKLTAQVKVKVLVLLVVKINKRYSFYF